MRLNHKLLRIAIGFISLMAISLSFAEDSGNANAEVINQHSNHIQTLAASCAACHGSAGNPVPNLAGQPKVYQLAGMNPEKFMAALQDFKSGTRASTVMHHHAKGLNAQEMSDLAHFFFAQKMQTVNALPTQVYEMHEAK
jgi:cytochrome subunit of sulfide dehydrogenase